ncbi:hypothetical protein EJB05_55228 [Eragrostis curvula]|uniref:Protein kinase domain-containing protein n=1 Tax=Eragrostis curvula TaxID=38414 RepID=A0A5J9SK83_9POAL|nr:hypothetical protein EJB05_55228 [Eragrostis curvula]
MWAHYKRVADVPDEDGRDFGTVADRVVGELWDFFRVEPEWRDRAVRQAYNACPKLVTDMHHEARVHAVRSYYAKFLGTMIDKKQARTIWLSAEEYKKVTPWWCASHEPCWDYFIGRWCDPEWQKMHEACRVRRLKMSGPAHHQGNCTLDEYAVSWSRAHEGRECPQLMAWALAHKGKASLIEVNYNPEDGPEAYSNPTVHAHLRQYTEMAREKHGLEWNPSTEDLDGEIIMKIGGGKKHGRYWIADSKLDTASTPTLSEIRARSLSSAPPIRPRSSAAQIQFEQAQAQLREEMEAKLQEQEARHQAQMLEQRAAYDASLQEHQARMQEEMQRQMQMMFHQWHNNEMQPPPLPLPPVIGTPSPGSFGNVVEARQRVTGEAVAVKALRAPPAVAAGDAKINKDAAAAADDEVLREAGFLVACRGHPALVDLHALAINPSTADVALVMECVGPSLHSILYDPCHRNGRPFLEADVRCIMRQLLGGVSHMHSLKIMHRDIKPGNILVVKGSAGGSSITVKICDFGLAASMSDKPAYDRAGTRRYMAPEVLLGKSDYDAMVDMWSLGCVMAELLIAKPLFGGEVDDRDQVLRIFKVLGLPGPRTWPAFKSLPLARTIPMPLVRHRNRLRDFVPKARLSEEGFNVLRRLLSCNVNKRISANAALRSPWFTDNVDPLASIGAATKTNIV